MTSTSILIQSTNHIMQVSFHHQNNT